MEAKLQEIEKMLQRMEVLQLILYIGIKGEDIKTVTRNLLVADEEGRRKQSMEICGSRLKKNTKVEKHTLLLLHWRVQEQLTFNMYST